MQDYTDYEAEATVANVKGVTIAEGLNWAKIDGVPLAMAYVPMQEIGKMYDDMTALEKGTLFPELDKPWLVGKRGR